MRKLIVAVLALLASGAALGAELEISQCKYPEPPMIPDGSSATESEMSAAGSAVREFVADVQTSLECLTAAEESMGEDVTEEQKAQLVAIYNNGVDQINAMAEKYNEQVRAFKAQ